MESQPQNPEFRINPENFHPCKQSISSSPNLPIVCCKQNRGLPRVYAQNENISNYDKTGWNLHFLT